MKFLVPILFLLGSCQGQVKNIPDKNIDNLTKRYSNKDSITIIRKDSLIVSLYFQLDSLKRNLFISNYKIEKVKYYLSICKRNPTQTKFLRGWITRSVE